jgi:hypothetical protein
MALHDGDMLMFKKNVAYTRAEIQHRVGGELQTYLPQKYGRILAGCFSKKLNPIRLKRGGATPTRVVFRDKDRYFPTAKDTYCWLIERFVETYPNPFINLN